MNNDIKFDQETSQPINKTEENSNIQPQALESINNQTTAQNQIQSQLQSIPTVEQNQEQFINNVQSMNKEKKEEKKEGVNFVFVIIMFVIILMAIYFLFPLLLDYI